MMPRKTFTGTAEIKIVATLEGGKITENFYLDGKLVRSNESTEPEDIRKFNTLTQASVKEHLDREIKEMIG